MTANNELLSILQDLRFYITPQHACSYLPREDAVTLFADPNAMMNERMYSTLVSLGFRRSGEHIYRPHCQACQQCIPVRIAVNRFVPNRSQRRTQQRNRDIKAQWHDAFFSSEHFRLYKQYLKVRHVGSSMATDDPEQYRRMMLTHWGSTRLLELRNDDRLVAVAITDWLEDGLSAVYTFFDPHVQTRGLGVYAILQQLATARTLGLPYLYLGYWIAHCANMTYKRHFAGLDYFDGQKWLPFK
ncbi:MAG: arginyltransferase [Gammaproteobacteria bacterium]|nr:arginyltransferase [Gammaproteobacteria bacterium]